MLTLLVKGGKCELISHFPHQIGKYFKCVSIKCREILSYTAGDHFGDQLGKIY